MRKYKEALEKMGVSMYRSALDLGCTRQYLGRVINREVGAGKAFEERWVSVYGELPEDDGIVRERSASPKVIKEMVPPKIPSVVTIVDSKREEVFQRINSVFGNKPLPKSNDEFVDLMVKSWATGVKDAVEFFASANAEE